MFTGERWDKIFSIESVKWLLIAALLTVVLVLGKSVYDNSSSAYYRMSDIDTMQKNRSVRMEVVEERSKRNERKVNLLVESVQAKNAFDQPRYEHFMRQIAEIQAAETEAIPDEIRRETEAKAAEARVHTGK